MSMNVTQNDLGVVRYKDADYRDDILNFSGAGTVAAGTILARHSGNGKLIPFVKGGSTDGNGDPKAVIDYPVTATAAGDIAVRVAVRGTFVKGRLVIDADGDDSNIDNVVLDQLRDYGLNAEDVQELNTPDNQ